METPTTLEGTEQHPGSDEQVEELLRLITVPARRREPRIAEQLKEAELQWVDTPHGRVAAWRLGEGPATLLVHGWEDDHCLWTRLLRALTEASMPVVVFDLPGHGSSEGTVGYTFEVADAIQSVAAALGPVRAIVAHSFSGGPAVVVQTEGLRVERTVLVSTPFSRPSATPRGDAQPGPSSAPVHDRWVRKGLEHGYPEDVAHRARAKYLARFSELRATYDWWAEVPRLDTDLLFVHSTADERAPIDDVRAVVLTCPRGELVEVHGLDHRGTARDPHVIDRVIGHLRA